MAKPIEYITELNKAEAKAFLADMLKKEANPQRDATLKRARSLHVKLK